jgi:enhancer of mRNA-decapping protein 3
MAEQFVGLTMLVTLSSPLDAQLRGRVSSVVAGQSLTLSDGTFAILGDAVVDFHFTSVDD